MSYVIGVDESAVLCDVIPFNRAVGRDLADSKKLTDSKRRSFVLPIQKHAIAYKVMTVPVEAIAMSQRKSWRQAITAAVSATYHSLEAKRKLDTRIIIDGPEDAKLLKMLVREVKLKGWQIKFEHEADDKYPSVMAGAILAKTARNDAMIALDSQFPEFLWAKNAGYGTAEHREACRKFGVTEHHRPIRSLRECKEYEPRTEWWSVG
jgi:ribonuclease HII